tara:strand:- start:552 stop:842 length:291 start_codon:yes stop_codon:yes gene_type:complete
LFFVGVVEKEVMASAMAGYDGHRGSVYYLAVSPTIQGLGYGKLMMQRVEDALKAMGCPKINIVVRKSNESVLEFYGRLGYATDEVTNLGRRLIPDL